MKIDRPITIAVILFVILLLIFFLAVPEYNKFKKLQIDLGQKRAEYNAEYDYYNTIEKMYSVIQGRKEDIAIVDDSLPTLSQSAVLGKLIYFLQGTAKENGLLVKNLFLSKLSSVNAQANNTGGVKDIIFSMDLSGSYSALGGFISSLEKSSRIFEITSISFGSTSGPIYNFSLQIKTHSY